MFAFTARALFGYDTAEEGAKLRSLILTQVDY